MQLGDDDLDLSICAQCLEQFDAALERAYSFGEEQVLCFECAIARGGVYDELQDRWVEPPNVRGLEPQDEHAHP